MEDPTQTTAPPQYLTREQVHALIAAAKPGRDRLFIRVAWETGARVSEIIALEAMHVDLGHGMLCFAGTVDPLRSVDGRWIPISRELTGALEVLFPAKPTGYLHERPFDFNRHTAWRIVRDAGRRAGLVLGDDARDITPDALRHSFAMHCVVEGVPLEIVQQVTGGTPAQTAKYRAAAATPARVREFLRKVVF